MRLLLKEDLTDFGIILEHFPNLYSTFNLRFTSISNGPDCIILYLFDRFCCASHHRCAAAGTKSRTTTKRRLALGALLQSWLFGVFFIYNSVLSSDFFVHFFVSDTKVDAELAGVLYPVDAVLNDLFVKSLTYPSANNTLSEVWLLSRSLSIPVFWPISLIRRLR